MAKGTVAGFHNGVGCIITEEKKYDFNASQVEGGIRNGAEVEFEFKNGVLTVYGIGATKPTPAPQPKQKPKQKQNSTSKLVDNFTVDNRELLTEDK